MISDLEDHLGYWLRFVSNHVSHAFALKLQAHDVTAAEWVILRELFARRNAAPSAIAERIGMTRGAVTKLVDRLAAKALVIREESAGDRRYQVLALTPAGRRLVPTLAALADRNDAEFFGHLEPAQRAAFERLLKDVVQRHGFKTFPTT
jgi:DNA-binding MarR family transcriptional regulator